jgi:hypothetical protein
MSKEAGLSPDLPSTTTRSGCCSLEPWQAPTSRAAISMEMRFLRSMIATSLEQFAAQGNARQMLF